MTREEACRMMLCGMDEIGFRTRQKLVEFCGSYENAVDHPPEGAAALMRLETWNKVRKLKSVSTEQAEEALTKAGARVMFKEDADFPPLLGAIIDPPEALFYKGTLAASDERAVAVVGSRRETRYGREQAFHLAKDLAERGVTIISGLAYGVDAAAHRGALAAGGRTVAVLGSGIKRIYPKEHEALAEEIVLSGGAVVSEYGLSAPPAAFHFPFRNRLVSGLAQALLLIEAREKSGTLITVNHALEQGREVFCLPGPVDHPASMVPNRLIREGAQVCTRAEDILEDMRWDAPPRQMTFDDVAQDARELTKDEQKIYDALCRDACDFEELINQTGLDAQQLNTHLVFMEMRGLVETLPGRRYRLPRRGD